MLLMQLDAPRCTPERVATHKRLTRTLRQMHCVEAVDFLSPSETRSGHAETEVVAEANTYDSLPNYVALKIVASGLSIHESQPWQNPDYQRAIVR
jgi:hypothetical protein